MGIFDRFRSVDESRGRTYEGPRIEPSEDEQALARCRYMLKTAPPETIEQAHVAEVRQPGTMERLFSRVPAAAPGFGGMMAGILLGSMAGRQCSVR